MQRARPFVPFSSVLSDHECTFMSWTNVYVNQGTSGDYYIHA
jgi:hypothetical protein